jgi:PKD repeat protein
MKRHYLLIFTFFVSTLAFAQCDDCTIDESCSPEGGLPGVCPEIMPAATAGVEYSEHMTFYLPAAVLDPGTGLTADLLEVVITNVQGLPFGMAFSMNNENNTYYPQDGDTYGCSTICGVPLLAGEYNIAITAHVTVVALGFEVETDEVFLAPFTVLPGEGGNSSFTYDNLAGCGTLDVNFEGLINGDPNPTTYAWDFGNGETGEGQFPPTVTYDEVGDFTATLETTIWDYVLTDLLLSGVGGGWSGDIEELTTLQNPDPFFVLTDANGIDVFTSSSITDSQSGSWTNIGFVLNNPPYTISFWDEDLITSNDYLGSWDMPTGEGSTIFSASGNNGSVNVDLVAGDVFTNDEVMSVFPAPNTEFMVDEEINLIWYEDPELTAFQWFLTGDSIIGSIDTSLIMNWGGVYTCHVTNIYGCEGLSPEYVHCPEFGVQLDSETMTLEAPGGYLSYQWFYNGLAIDDAIADFIVISDLGNYSVQVTTDYGCTTMSDVYIFTGMDEIKGLHSFDVFPNPSDGTLYLEVQSTRSLRLKLEVFDQSGRLVYKERDAFAPGERKALFLNELSAGIYLLRASNSSGFVQQQVVIR